MQEVFEETRQEMEERVRAEQELREEWQDEVADAYATFVANWLLLTKSMLQDWEKLHDENRDRLLACIKAGEKLF